MATKKDKKGNNGFILMSKIGKSTTNMHRVFHIPKEFARKESIPQEEEESDDEPVGIDIM